MVERPVDLGADGKFLVTSLATLPIFDEPAASIITSAAPLPR